jgi:hypothetical protein
MVDQGKYLFIGLMMLRWDGVPLSRKILYMLRRIFLMD